MTFPDDELPTPPDAPFPPPIAPPTVPTAEESSPAVPAPPRTDLARLSASIAQVQAQLSRVIVGQQDVIDLLLVALLADGHVLLEGVPGVAKTLTAKSLARTLDVPFGRIQFTPDLMPADVLGTSVFRPTQADFIFRPGPIFASVVLIDEINRAPAKTQAALFEVMEERQVTYDGVRHPLPAPFVVLATQNPIEQEGTYRLPEAQLDRFLFKVSVGYPPLADELKILAAHHAGRVEAAALEPVLSATDVAALRAQVHRQHVEANLLDYIARLVTATRTHRALYLGASPRASLALLNGAKALAALRGRDFVTPDDIQFLTPAVLRHRILLTPEAELEGTTPDDVVKQLLQSQEVPR